MNWVSKFHIVLNSFLELTEGRIQIYWEYEKQRQSIARMYYRILTAAIVLGMGLPLLVVLFNYWRGSLTPDIWYIPMPGSFFYDITTSPGFELTYLWQMVTLIGIVRSYGAIDSLFMGLCIHIGAGYRDLCDMVLEIDVSSRILKTGVAHNDNLESISKQLPNLPQRLNEFVDFFVLMDEYELTLKINDPQNDLRPLFTDILMTWKESAAALYSRNSVEPF